jgi:hypothetical protein
MTNDEIESALQALRHTRREIEEFQAALKTIPDDTLPADYDAVNMAEWTDTLATQTSASHGVSAFLGSFWESHHMLAEHIPYERAVRAWFDWAHDMIGNEMDNLC